MSYSAADLKRWSSIAEAAALRSGRFLAGMKKKDKRIKVDTGCDIKISADTESEGIIIDLLRKRSGLPILSEEAGMLDGSTKDGLYWAVDPLDGSLNFLREIPISCVSIGLMDKESPVLGVIYDFNKKELFTGIVGKGAWLNKRRISVSRTRERKKAILFTGVPIKADKSKDSSMRLVSQMRQYRKLRWLGSAALSLAYVAAGRGDAYFEDGIMLWDIAAGAAIASAAGAACYVKRLKHNSCCIYTANKHLSGRNLMSTSNK